MIHGNLNINGAKRRAAFPTAEVKAYIDGLVTPLSLSQVKLIDTFVKDVKSGLGIDNLSDAFDVMYILANETEESSLRNLVKRAHDGTAVNSPTFTALEGFTGDGTSAYLNLNYDAKLDGVNCMPDSFTYAIYFMAKDRGLNKFNGVYSTDGNGGTSNRNVIASIDPTRMSYALNSNVYVKESELFSQGQITLVRNNLTTLSIYKNKVKEDAAVPASLTCVDQDLVSLARRSTDGSIGLFSADQQSFLVQGKGLTEIQQNALYDAFQKYMTSNGKQV